MAAVAALVPVLTTVAKDLLDASLIKEMVVTTTMNCRLLSAEEPMSAVACAEALPSRTMEAGAKTTVTVSSEGTTACEAKTTSTCRPHEAISTTRVTSRSVAGARAPTTETTTPPTTTEVAEAEATTAVEAMMATVKTEVVIVNSLRTLPSTTGSRAVAAAPTTALEAAVEAMMARVAAAMVAAECADPAEASSTTSVSTTPTETSKVAMEVVHASTQVVAEAAVQLPTTTTDRAMTTQSMARGVCAVVETTPTECKVTAKVASTAVARPVTEATIAHPGTRGASSAKMTTSAACRLKSSKDSNCAGSADAVTCACVVAAEEALLWAAEEISMASAVAWVELHRWEPRLAATLSNSEHCVTQLVRQGKATRVGALG